MSFIWRDEAQWWGLITAIDRWGDEWRLNSETRLFEPTGRAKVREQLAKACFGAKPR